MSLRVRWHPPVGVCVRAMQGHVLASTEPFLVWKSGPCAVSMVLSCCVSRARRCWVGIRGCRRHCVAQATCCWFAKEVQTRGPGSPMEHSEALGLWLPRPWAASSELDGPRASLWAPGAAESSAFQGPKLNPARDTEPGPNTLPSRPMMGQN